MENASEKRVNDFAEDILSLADKIEDIDLNLIFSVLNRYKKIPEEFRDILGLRDELEKKYPALFKRKLLTGEKQELPLNQINLAFEEQADSFAVFKKIKKSLEVHEDFIKRIKTRIKFFSLDSDCYFSFRIKDFESFSENFSKISLSRSLIDIVGMRLVLKKTKMLLKIISEFEREFSDEITFKLNIIAFNDDEITRKIGQNSIYYRAVHYYLSVAGFFIEVQIRTPFIDQWSNMHHDTVYKPKISVTEKEKKQIMEFGKISNVVDYFELIKNG